MAFDFSQYPQAPDTGISTPPGGVLGPNGLPANGNTGINGGAISTGLQVQPAGGGSMSPQDAQAYFQSKFPPGQPLSPQMLLAAEADLKAHGITLIKNAAGQPGKVQLSDGSAYDVIQGAGSGQNIGQWNQIAGPGGAPTGVNGSAGGTLGSLGYSFGDAMQKFVPPTAEDALNSPGLQFALSEANRMGQNSAAARGTLLNGRFQQALNASNIQNALQGYQGVYDRSYQTFTRNQDAPFSKQLSLAQLGKPT